MIIAEKALIHHIKQAYRESGYTIAVRDNVLAINGSRWAVTMPQDDISRKVLGVLVEHIGGLPTDEPVWVRKDCPNQVMLNEDRFGWLNNRYDVRQNLIPIIYKNHWQLYQSSDGITGIDTESLQLVLDMGVEAFASGHVVQWTDGIQAIYICTMARNPNTHIDYMEQFDWTLPDGEQQ